jgi:cell division initiation protein
MKITPVDIQNQQFKIRFRGFDVREVDQFLEQMAASLQAMQEASDQQEAQIEQFQKDLKDFKEREESFKRAMLNSQKTFEQMKKNAHKAADLITSNAEVRAEKLLNRAHNRLAQLHEDITELKRQRMQIEVQIRAILDTHSRILDIGNEEMQRIDAEDDKVKLLRKP